MKPCCLPSEELCINIDNPINYWGCEADGGTLGPEGTCCRNPNFGECTVPDENCWRCPWDIVADTGLVSCCFPYHDWQYFPKDDTHPGIMEGQCGGCSGSPRVTQEDCNPPAVALRPCCQAFGLCRNVSPSQEADCIRNGGELGAIGTCCQVTDTQPFCYENTCWRCDFVPTPTRPLMSCCFENLNYHWMELIHTGQCDLCGGQIGVEEVDCQAPVPEPECIDEPREDRPNPDIRDDDGIQRQWTLDTVGTVVFGMSPWEDTQQGYQYPVSTHLIRSQQAETPGDSCRFHAAGRKVMLDDGYVYTETLSKPDRTSMDSCRRSYGVKRTFLPDKDDPLAQRNRALGMQDGYQYSVTRIRLPWWTDVMYRSYMARCGSDPV